MLNKLYNKIVRLYYLLREATSGSNVISTKMRNIGLMTIAKMNTMLNLALINDKGFTAIKGNKRTIVWFKDYFDYLDSVKIHYKKITYTISGISVDINCIVDESMSEGSLTMVTNNTRDYLDKFGDVFLVIDGITLEEGH